VDMPSRAGMDEEMKMKDWQRWHVIPLAGGFAVMRGRGTYNLTRRISAWSME
jgi:hypothetical protein